MILIACSRKSGTLLNGKASYESILAASLCRVSTPQGYLLDEKSRLLDLNHALWRGRLDLFDSFCDLPGEVEQGLGMG